MYAIFETGGKQYKVSAGDVLRIEKVQGAAGDSIKFSNVLAFSDDNGNLKTGTPYLEAAVNATILSEGKGKKVVIFKFKAKKDYRKKQGHRQPYTEIEIDNFTVDGKKVGKKPEKPVVEEKAKSEPAKEEKTELKEKVKKAKDKAEEVVETVEEEVVEIAEEVKTEIKEKAKETKAKAKEVVEAVEEIEAEIKEKVKETKAKAKAVVEKVEEEVSEVAEVIASKMTKADIMAKLDGLGAEYSKSAKKDELLAILTEAESK